MEDSNLYALSDLLSKLLVYLGNSQLSQTEVLQQTIRYTRKNKKCRDLFLCVTQHNQEKARLCIENNTEFNISNVCTDLPKISKEWHIPISACSFNKSGLILNLKRCHAFKTVMSEVFSKGKEYGKVCSSDKTLTGIIFNEQSGDQFSDLSKTRVILGAKVIANLLQASGREIEINIQSRNKEQREFFFTHKSKDDSAPPGSTSVTCGVVLNIETGCKETTQTATDYCRQWEDVISTISEGRYTGVSKEVQSEINARIARAAVLFDLLGVKFSNCVSLKQPSLENQKCYGVSSKGAPFVLYNSARLASILSQFSKNVNTGYYPELPPLSQVDTSLLMYEEEWTLLLDFVMIYPHVLRESLFGLNEGKPSIHVFVAFVNAFCKEISLYYRRVRILTEPRSQLLPTMFARLYLLKSIEQVLHNALDILGIEPLLHM